MSQQHNLAQADPTTFTTAAPHAPEAPMAVTPTPSPTELTTPRTPRSASTSAPLATAAPEQATTGDAVLTSVTRPQLRSLTNPGDHQVPATARYADQLTHGALALRLQAVTRLGLPTPRHLSSTTPQAATPSPAEAGSAHAGLATSGKALNSQIATRQASPQGVEPHTPHAGVADATPADAGMAHASQANADVADRPIEKLSVVQDNRSATPADAAPGRPDGAQAPLNTTPSTRPAEDARRTAPGTAGGQAVRGAGAAGARGTAAVSAASRATSGTAVVGGEEARRGEVPGLPGARVWGGRLAQAVSEVLAGDRPISQLVRFTDDAVFMDLNRRVRMLGLNSTAGSRGAKEKSTVRSVRVFMPNPSIAEVAAHVRYGRRSRAIALRLEVRRNRWVCTALELG
ncbi:Rv3235 family protein [Kribbella shirazensis]|uniref:Uncharacterized protein n=1 Tax=Kribbella shirazensis TaxID=1105143 RepID=A0A7X5VJL5_9ACTN|nr:Rv3235 family protein [Kribbella shirazensis]NIK62056.1 hypothetical protein [Kribbella shirazensis]